MLPVVAIVGRPNVGKSTLFNALTRTRDALVADMPGVTRDRQYGISDVGDRACVLIDTGGLIAQAEGIDYLTPRQVHQAIVESQLVLFVVSARDGLTIGDQEIASLLREHDRPVLLIGNKVDGTNPDIALAEFAAIVGPQGAEAIIFWSTFPDGAIAQPCGTLLDRVVGPTAADLAAAVVTAPGAELVVEPSDVTVGGRTAKYVELRARGRRDCAPGFFYTWRDVSMGPLWPWTPPRTTIRVWIVDVVGELLFLEAETTAQASLDLEREIREIVRSFRIEA